jgi:hypothetical protein
MEGGIGGGVEPCPGGGGGGGIPMPRVCHVAVRHTGDPGAALSDTGGRDAPGRVSTTSAR